VIADAGIDQDEVPRRFDQVGVKTENDRLLGGVLVLLRHKFLRC
jgi:hypothetical protein